MNYAICTTFANGQYPTWGKEMLNSVNKSFPPCHMLVHLDNEMLIESVSGDLTNHTFCASTPDDVQNEFLAKYKGTDDKQNYRKQFVRFSHKVFTIYKALDYCKGQNLDYLFWIDADVKFNKAVDQKFFDAVLPKDDEIVSYIGRKDWNHSECGFMVFDVKKAENLINAFIKHYIDGTGLNLEEWHDSFIFDRVREIHAPLAKNISADASGMDVWEQTILGEYSQHFKGPVAKNELAGVPQQAQPIPQMEQQPGGYKPLVIETVNSVQDDSIKNNVTANLRIIENWIGMCDMTDEKVVICSAGPSLDPEMVRPYYDKGYKVVAVKHAIDKLLGAGIVPWACILLDPRPHVEDFVENPDHRVIYFVASQVCPEVTQKLLDKGCTVWGYHAAVGAGEDKVLPKGHFMVSGGSASATRGMFMLNILGFRNFELFGYDLCHYKKPDLSDVDESGRNKYLEVSLKTATAGGNEVERTYWTEGQFLAQVQEIEKIFEDKVFDINAHGEGIVPWILRNKAAHKKWWKQMYKVNQEPYNSYKELFGELSTWQKLSRFLNSLFCKSQKG
jgi:hypothetical protein